MKVIASKRFKIWLECKCKYYEKQENGEDLMVSQLSNQ